MKFEFFFQSLIGCNQERAILGVFNDLQEKASSI